MKRVFFTIYSLITLTCLFVGFYMAIKYFDKDQSLFVTFLMMHIVGWIFLAIEAMIIVMKKRNERDK